MFASSDRECELKLPDIRVRMGCYVENEKEKREKRKAKESGNERWDAGKLHTIFHLGGTWPDFQIFSPAWKIRRYWQSFFITTPLLYARPRDDDFCIYYTSILLNCIQTFKFGWRYDISVFLFLHDFISCKIPQRIHFCPLCTNFYSNYKKIRITCIVLI